MTEATKSNPAPLDAFESAKPDEPIWTVQGGDPLGGPLLRIWAIFARIQAGPTIPNVVNFVFEEILKAANKNIPREDKEKEELLIRATETEQISWTMDEYRQGISSGEYIPRKSFDVNERLDIHDIRRRCASFISASFSELNDYREALLNHGWLETKLDHEMKEIILDLRLLHDKIEIRREG